MPPEELNDSVDGHGVRRRTRDEVRQRRRRERVKRARRLRDRPPGETVEAAFDLAAFARELSQVTP
jgi:hypothetical protein